MKGHQIRWIDGVSRTRMPAANSDETDACSFPILLRDLCCLLFNNRIGLNDTRGDRRLHTNRTAFRLQLFDAPHQQFQIPPSTRTVDRSTAPGRAASFSANHRSFHHATIPMQINSLQGRRTSIRSRQNSDPRFKVRLSQPVLEC